MVDFTRANVRSKLGTKHATASRYAFSATIIFAAAAGVSNCSGTEFGGQTNSVAHTRAQLSPSPGGTTTSGYNTDNGTTGGDPGNGTPGGTLNPTGTGGGTGGPPNGTIAGGGTGNPPGGTIAVGGGNSGNGTSGLGSDGTQTLVHPSLILHYGAYFDGDGTDSNAATQTIYVKATNPNGGPNDADWVLVNPNAWAPGSNQQGTLTIPNECICGATTNIQIKVHAVSALGTIEAPMDASDAGMWNVANKPPKGASNKWDKNSYISSSSAPSGPNAVYMSNDHNDGGILGFLSTPCPSFPMFYCGSRSHDHPWQVMDDVQMAWQCDVSACGAKASGTALHFQGMENFLVEP